MEKTYLTENDLIVTPNALSELGFAEQYTLMTEISFMLAQNDAKIKYLDVTGFKLVLQTLFGKQRKGRIQWMKNTQAIQCKLAEIAEILDAELQELKKDQLDMMKKISAVSRRLLHTQDFVLAITDDNDLDRPENNYQQIIKDIEDTEKEMLHDLEELLQKQKADQEAAGTFRILRLIPREMAVITPSSVSVTPTQRDRRKEKWDHLISESEYEQAAALGEFDAVILPFGAPLGNIKTRRRLDFNDYQMMHYLHENHPPIGQQIAMIDYYDCKCHVSGYLITDNGYRKLFENRTTKGRQHRNFIIEDIHEWFSESGITPRDIQYLKSFSVDAYVKKTFTRMNVTTFSYDESILIQDESFRSALLNGNQ